jgi:Family of unknown function (DUF5677)
MQDETKPPQPTMTELLKTIATEALNKGKYNIPREGFFRCGMRASFVRAYQFAAYCNRIEDDKADEGCFFMASALRGTCEDLIALKFIRQLPRKLRDEVIAIEMGLAVNKAVVEQTKFFEKQRPFQQVISANENSDFVAKQRTRLYQIGTSSGLWKTEKKMLPIEQMAIKLKMKEMYDYFYRVTSDVVHFNPRILLRSGWGSDPKRGQFSMGHFSIYYLRFCQVYSVLLFAMMARAFAVDLSLSKEFKTALTAIEKDIDGILRWPEAVTYEEMNKKPPSEILAVLAKVMYDDPEGRKKFQQAARKKRGKA